jgi:cysteine desulfurase
MTPRSIYLDCAATTPVDPRVAAAARRWLDEDWGNAGSAFHEYGQRARQAVEQARGRVASVVEAGRGEVIFTSGATESNNLAILGLAAYGERMGRRHILTTSIEHPSVLEPVRHLETRGFEITWLSPVPGGWVSAADVAAALRPDTLLASVMHVNNETGTRQPVREIAAALRGHPAYLHVDAAQGFGKELEALRDPRLDLISISGHKLFAPQGIGALVARRRGRERPPLAPLVHGGGQEFGLRSGTLPVALIAALGRAAELACLEAESRAARCLKFRRWLLEMLQPLSPRINGDPDRCVPHILNISFPGLTADDVMDAWAGIVALSDGAACSSEKATCSHVLAALGLPAERAAGAVRLSGYHDTPRPDGRRLVDALGAQVRLAPAVAGGAA